MSKKTCRSQVTSKQTCRNQVMSKQTCRNQVVLCGSASLIDPSALSIVDVMILALICRENKGIFALCLEIPQLMLEAMWWYSAASFTYAVLGVQAALIGATSLASRPRPALISIGVGSALGPTASTIGVLGMPLAVFRTLIDPKTAWRGKAQGTLAAFGGLGIYLVMRELIGAGLFQAAPRQAAGLAEPITVWAMPLPFQGAYYGPRWPAFLRAGWPSISQPAWHGCWVPWHWRQS
jgi:hypothetical protein